MTGDTVVALLRALVSLGVVLGLIWWAGRRLSTGKGPVGRTASVSATSRPATSGGRVLARLRALGSGAVGALGGRRGTAPAPAIVVLGRQSLTPKAGLALVEVGGRRLLLGVGDQGVTVLDTQDAPVEAVPEPAIDAGLQPVADAAPGSPDAEAAFAAELDHAVGLTRGPSARPERTAAAVVAGLEVNEAQVLTLPSHGDALDGSILSPATWRRAASALQSGRR